MVTTMRELEERTVQSTIISNNTGCYHCTLNGITEPQKGLHAWIYFKDKSSVHLCTKHFVRFKQKR